MDSLIKFKNFIIIICIAVFPLYAVLGIFGTDVCSAEQKKPDYKKVYKENDKAMKNAPTKYKSGEKSIPITRYGEKKSDLVGIPKGSYMMKGKQRGRPPGEEKAKKDLGIDPASKRGYRMTGDATPGHSGVKESDIKGYGTKPGVKQYKTMDKIPDKDIKNKKVTKVR